MTIPTRRYDLHPKALDIGPAGISDFVLPYDVSESSLFWEKFSVSLSAYLRVRGIENDRTVEVIWLAAAQIAFEAASLFHLVRLSHCFRMFGYLASWGGPHSALEQVGAGEPPSSPILVRALSGPNVSALRSPWARWVTSLVRSDGYSRKPPSLIDRSNDALCVVGGSGVEAVAKAEGKKLVLTRYQDWMDIRQGWQNRLPQPLMRDAIDDLASIASENFEELGETMPVHVRESLKTTILTLVRIAEKSLVEVEGKAGWLPKTFITGSTTSLQNMAIARVVQKEGGTVTSFDHGTGGGWHHIPSSTMTAWDLPNKMITFTETHAAGITRLMDPRYRVNRTALKVVASSVPLIASKTAPSINLPKQRSKCPRIMYVPTLYVGERYFEPQMPIDFAEIDFQVRLMAHIRGRGFALVIKPHPECEFGIRSEITQAGDATLELSLFEQVVGEVDLFLFDCSSSTAFRSAVCTNIPIVIIDHGLVPITEHALSLIKKRTAVITTRRDEHNRIDLDWSGLDRAIEVAPELRDPTFANLYFGADI